ncbi:hypothetical protein CDAR_462571 [Caerostris darwini]|uniref:Uncharacterized protein n=1 Tax=Caerostris darwini TaxID=1538125 RepID=A0AAV4WQY9_9ARAC|nr:hypothetical protein CDAR_462571 [Caerostris darwini]
MERRDSKSSIDDSSVINVECEGSVFQNHLQKPLSLEASRRGNCINDAEKNYYFEILLTVPIGDVGLRTYFLFSFLSLKKMILALHEYINRT